MLWNFIFILSILFLTVMSPAWFPVHIWSDCYSIADTHATFFSTFSVSLRCLKCCFWCLEKFLKFLNKNAYIEVSMLRAVHTWDFACYDCHPGVCNKLVTVYEARYPLMFRCSLSSTLSSIQHILQDVNRKAQNRSCKQPLGLLRSRVKLVAGLPQKEFSTGYRQNF